MSYKYSDVLYESGDYWILRTSKGLEIYQTGTTHSIRRGQVGHSEEVSLEHAKKWIKMYQTDDIRNNKLYRELFTSS